METVWNVGGKDIYEMGLKHPWMHKLLITRIEGDFGADVHFPAVNWSDFERTEEFPGEKEKVEEKGITWYIESYVKKA